MDDFDNPGIDLCRSLVWTSGNAVEGEAEKSLWQKLP